MFIRNSFIGSLPIYLCFSFMLLLLLWYIVFPHNFEADAISFNNYVQKIIFWTFFQFVEVAIIKLVLSFENIIFRIRCHIFEPAGNTTRRCCPHSGRSGTHCQDPNTVWIPAKEDSSSCPSNGCQSLRGSRTLEC